MLDRLYRRIANLYLILACTCAIACTGCVAPTIVAVRPLPPETPSMNLPKSLRQENWLYAGEGSCVHASTCSHLRWLGLYDLAAQWRRKYGGGEYASGILAKYQAEGLQSAHTMDADPRFLEWVTARRSGAIIWFFPSHCVNFVGFGRDERGQEVAYLLDNNRTAQFLRIPKAKFLQAWASYGGFAACAVSHLPPPPLPFPAYRVIR